MKRYLSTGVCAGVAIVGVIVPARAEKAAPSNASLPMPAGVADGPSGVSASLGLTSWSGDFGASSTTDISAASLSLRYETGNVRLSALLPWVRIRSQGAVFTGIGGTPLVVAPAAATAAPGKRVRQDIGDLTLGASYALTSADPNAVSVDFFGRVKVPTSKGNRGVSTGKVDYLAGAEVSKNFGRFAPLASVSYRVFGDSRAWNLRNGIATSVGGTFQASRRSTYLLTYDYARAASPFLKDSHELVGGTSWAIGRKGLRVSAFGSAGLSSGAAAFSTGASLAAKF